jgi:predicted small lipoprotein YifL
MRTLSQLVALCTVAALAACSVNPVTFPLDDGAPTDDPRAEDCNAIGDEDGNGLADCSDPVCASTPVCQIDVPHQGIRVTTTGPGRGTITATVGAAPCDAACLERLPLGTPVQLTATAAPGSWFHGWTAGCDGRHTCSVVAADGLTVTGDFTDEPNRVFLSSTMHDGNFGGLAGGDAICQQLAQQAGLTGLYRILLSIPPADWSTRIAGARGWIRVDGEPVGDTTLGDGAGLYNVRIDEHGADVGLGQYWAVGPTAIFGSTYCAGWSSNLGGATNDQAANYGYTTRTAHLDTPIFVGSVPCSQPNRFLCAEVDRQVAVAPIATSGRLAFVTTGSWDTTSGLAAADALCTSEAGAAGKPGSFKALLSTSTASAISRFDTAGAPWVRADGLPLLASAKSFESAAYLDTAPGVRLDGSVQPTFTVIPFGAQTFDTPGSLGTTCNDWTTLSVIISAQGFTPWDTGPRMAATTCNQSLPVLCLQE